LKNGRANATQAGASRSSWIRILEHQNQFSEKKRRIKQDLASCIQKSK
jgi:hypothetical protein